MIADFAFLGIFMWQTEQVKGKKLYLVDIDNTVAHTWPSHNYSYDTVWQKYASIAVIWTMFLKIKALQEKKNSHVVFLSARPVYLYIATLNWFRSNQYPLKWHQLYLVSNAKKKLMFLSHLSKKNIEVIYIDDLSYNHENGDLKLYSDVIGHVKAKENFRLTYLGWDYVEKVATNEAN